MVGMSICQLVPDATDALLEWARQVQTEGDNAFETNRILATRLGAHVKGEHVEVGYWIPEIAEQSLPKDKVFLEIFTANAQLDLAAKNQSATFQRERIPLQNTGDFYWGVIQGMTVGTKEQVGSFYQVTFQDKMGVWQRVPDYLAYSVPFGAFAPAELYNVKAMLEARADSEHFADLDTEPDPDGIPRVKPPINILQIHVPTASPSGTLAGLTHIYETIAEKLERNETLTPAETNFMSYEAVQLMPIEPIIEYEAGSNFWSVTNEEGDNLTIELRRPDMTNWGYDVLISASSATNPVLLESGRPDELLEFIETLHTFPGGAIKVILDVVYGHTDNQALGLLNKNFLAGPGMYGQNMAFRHPVTRAMMLEMQRRKSNYGVDGLRVDGAQDFKYWNPETQELLYDDDYLHLMNDTEQEVAGVRYRPYMIFEDGRPWPRDDWELSSTYREITKIMPNVFQWGPLTFAHNTPFLFTFWLTKWWRIREIAEVGDKWITGCANHDTLRRGTQVPTDARINTYLGDSLPEILRNAYDNPAAKLFDYAMMPGLPMDFINAAMRAPWSFIRNTDDRYGVKVVSEEARFLDWAVDEASFSTEGAFTRLKGFGFNSLEGLKRFLYALDHAVKLTDYDLAKMATLLGRLEPSLEGPELTPNSLKQIAKAWMDDLHDYCTITPYAARLDPEHTDFMRALRDFRLERPWLMDNLGEGEHLDYQHPSDKSVIFYGLRRNPNTAEKLLFIANMEGATSNLIPHELPLEGLEGSWHPALATPGLNIQTIDTALELEDSQGVVFISKV